MIEAITKFLPKPIGSTIGIVGGTNNGSISSKCRTYKSSMGNGDNHRNNSYYLPFLIPNYSVTNALLVLEYCLLYCQQ